MASRRQRTTIAAVARQTSASTSWESAGRWYDGIVGKEGHHFHQQLVIPGVLRLLRLDSSPKVASSLLDLGCGQGVLGRQVPKGVEYVGVDASKFLVRKAQAYDTAPQHRYAVADVTRPYDVAPKSTGGGFSHAAFVLSLQNMRDQAAALRIAGERLGDQGRLVVVLNHPCFRVPRQSRWEVDPQNNAQYRRVDRYHSPLEVPIMVHPGVKKGGGATEPSSSAAAKSEGASPTTYSYHYPLDHYFRWLSDAGMAVELIEEWYSDKTSEGSQAKRENRARTEFPLFLAISSFKLQQATQ